MAKISTRSKCNRVFKGGTQKSANSNRDRHIRFFFYRFLVLGISCFLVFRIAWYFAFLCVLYMPVLCLAFSLQQFITSLLIQSISGSSARLVRR